ncbi:RagB/SusD family nutrient uptake outer membrane protein [Flavisolibacter tropicus]|uniref:Carbohydrate-binding protein SusD n=1 Tax=Flavisolibacter tropicus TaxID=1492898 RepID=A0A172TYJ6_9BACT|nr:RagB/SusD family nutrient uptake outer membrane protein [Flavisolibacter tropicus]ANE52038.1 hypothetical protein SY85_17585 [Flavisolibacter tropicus]
MKRSLFYILFAGMVFSGCKKDFLETKPTTSIDAPDAFSTPDKVTAAMNGLYDLMTLSTFTNHIMLTTDIKGGDMLVVSTGNYSRFVTEYQFLQSPTAGYGTQFWRDGFRLISNTNQAIKNLPTAPISDAQKNDFLAEARMIRAWGNYQLVRLFGQPYSVAPTSLGIPKLETPIGEKDPTPARATVKEIYDFIVADLTFAATNLSSTRNSVFRVTKNAAYGMLARVYLDMEQWKLASDNAKLARAGFSLAPGADLLKGFVDPTSEWIWGLDYRSDDNSGYLQVASFQEPYDIGYSTFRATSTFFNLFAADDIRKKLFYVNETKVATYEGDALQRDKPMISRDGYLMNKFYFRSAWDLDVPLMRSAEMYLIEAEAEAELGNTVPAQTALYAVQKRSIPTAVISANTGNALKAEIQVERRKELFGEGFRFFDILRRKETLVRTSPEHWAPLTLAPGAQKNILPIPQSEREVSGLPQNPGYN